MEIACQVPCTWRPPPLTDPSSQIRLLWVHAGAKDEEIRCTISVWNREDAPDFRAISYTWGPPQPKAFITITFITSSPREYAWECVDRTRLEVHESARYALGQARLHYPDSYIWIDSVCINQTDLREKAAQVTIMAKIYRKAEMVLACVGHSDDSSDAIYEVCSQLDEAIPDYAYEYGEFLQVDDYRAWHQLKGLIDCEMESELIEHWSNFTAREYWSRVWIVQELHGSRRWLEVLCGELIMSWQVLLVLESIIDNKPWPHGSDHIIEELDLYMDIDQSDYPDGNLSVFWAEMADRSCGDVRDRVYSVLGMYPWERAGIPKPRPDYEISCFDLAVRLLPQTGTINKGDARIIMKALELDKIDIDDLTRQFRASESISRLTDTASLHLAIMVNAVCLIQQDCEGLLCATVDYAELGTGSVEDSIAQELCPTWRRAMCSVNSPWDNGLDLIQIQTGNQMSLIAWPEIKPGDILIDMGLHSVVIRQTTTPTRFQVVGHAILHRSLPTKLESWPCDCWSSAGANGGQPWLCVSFANLTRADALMQVAFGDRGVNALPPMERDWLSFPAIGSYVEDISNKHWSQRTTPQPNEAACGQHKAEDCFSWCQSPILFAANLAAGLGLTSQQPTANKYVHQR